MNVFFWHLFHYFSAFFGFFLWHNFSSIVNTRGLLSSCRDSRLEICIKRKGMWLFDELLKMNFRSICKMFIASWVLVNRLIYHFLTSRWIRSNNLIFMISKDWLSKYRESLSTYYVLIIYTVGRYELFCFYRAMNVDT